MLRVGQVLIATVKQSHRKVDQSERWTQAVSTSTSGVAEGKVIALPMATATVDATTPEEAAVDAR